MDKIIGIAVDLKKELNETSEIKTYLENKKLYETNEELKYLREEIARLTSLGKTKEKENLLAVYNSYPIVVNYLTSKEEAINLVSSLKNIIN